MKGMLIVVAMLMLAGMANAQTCTPVTISYPNPDPTDAGNGNQDNWQFGIYWWSFHTPVVHESITVTAGPYFFNDAITGFANVRSGFGGCQLRQIDMDVTHQYVLYDTGTGVHWSYPPVTENYNCGKAGGPFLSGCAFNAQWDPTTPGAQQRTDLVSGHHYRLDSNTYATMYNVGQSPTYTYSIYITVE